jgi:hypothetical protein
VNRTGALWLFFSGAEALAAARPSSPEHVYLVGALRLMDVPADLLYLARSHDLGAFGRAGLVVSPIFNACAGAYLMATGARALRAARARPMDRAAPTRRAAASAGESAASATCHSL